MVRLSRYVARRVRPVAPGRFGPSGTDRPDEGSGRSSTRGEIPAQRLLVVAGTVLFVAGLAVVTGVHGVVMPGGQSASSPDGAAVPTPTEPPEGDQNGAEEPPTAGGTDESASSQKPTGGDDPTRTATPTEESGIGIDLPLGL